MFNLETLSAGVHIAFSAMRTFTEVSISPWANPYTGENAGKNFYATIPQAQPLYRRVVLPPPTPSPPPPPADIDTGDQLVVNNGENDQPGMS